MGLIFIPDQAGGPAVKAGIATWDSAENYAVDDEVIYPDGS